MWITNWWFLVQLSSIRVKFTFDKKKIRNYIKLSPEPVRGDKQAVRCRKCGKRRQSTEHSRHDKWHAWVKKTIFIYLLNIFLKSAIDVPLVEVRQALPVTQDYSMSVFMQIVIQFNPKKNRKLYTLIIVA